MINAVTFNLPYDPRTDFEPVGLVAVQPLLIIGRKTFEPNTLKELLAWLKAHPGKATQGTAGMGTSGISSLFFKKITGTEYQLVPYRGNAFAMNDLLSGQIDFMIDQAVSSVPQVRSGAVKGYAVTAPTRLWMVPDVPTVDEAGLPGYHVVSWHAVWAPKGTPTEIIAKLNAALVAALADPTAQKRLADILGEYFYPRDQQTPEALRAYQLAECEKWWPIVKAAGIKIQQ